MQLYRQLAEGLPVAPLIASLDALDEAAWQGDPIRARSNVAAQTQAIRLTDPDSDAWHAFAPMVDPLLVQLLDTHFPGARRGKIVLSRIPAGKQITLHVDAEPDQATLHRVHVALVTNPRATLDFPMHRTGLQMAVGDAVEINSRQPHAAVNRGDTARVHLVFDAHVERS